MVDFVGAVGRVGAAERARVNRVRKMCEVRPDVDSQRYLRMITWWK